MYSGTKKGVFSAKNPLTNKFIPIQSLADSRQQTADSRQQTADSRDNRRNSFKYSKYIWSVETSGTFLWQGIFRWSFFV